MRARPRRSDRACSSLGQHRCRIAVVHENESDLKELQQVLDRSYAVAGEHLRSILRPERRMSAEELAELLRGVFVLNVATVTAAGHPIVAPVDGLFYRGKVLFGFPPGSVRGRHVRARPHVSAVHNRGEDYCVIVHGVAREIDLDAPENAEFLAYFKEIYGASWTYWHEEHYKDREGTEFNGWIEPRRMFTMKPTGGGG